MEFIQQNIYLVAIAILSGTMLLVTSLRRPGGGNALTPTQATLLINREDAQLVDVRDAAEFTAGHISSARNIPLTQLDDRLTELEKFKASPLILICQTGARSSGACGKLAKQGFSRVHNLAGGMLAWTDAGLPVRKGTKK